MIERVDGRFEEFAAIPYRRFGGGSAESTALSPDRCLGSEQSKDGGLLMLDDEVRSDGGKQWIKSSALYRPAVGWTPHAGSSPAARAKNISPRNDAASFKQRKIAVCRANLRRVRRHPARLLGFGDLKCSFALKKSGEPCPFCNFVYHG